MADGMSFTLDEYGLMISRTLDGWGDLRGPDGTFRPEQANITRIGAIPDGMKDDSPLVFFYVETSKGPFMVSLSLKSLVIAVEHIGGEHQ